ncbi:MAG: hypothetical protein KIT17_15390 [Rubrivivax sp.]|nr:hypothetical protein [Rubrivivax sp.]
MEAANHSPKPTPTREEHTTAAANTISTDAHSVIEVINTALAEGEPQNHYGALSAALVVVARMGALADAIAAANDPGRPCPESLASWMFRDADGDLTRAGEAFEALEREGQAKIEAARLRDRERAHG